MQVANPLHGYMLSYTPPNKYALSRSYGLKGCVGFVDDSLHAAQEQSFHGQNFRCAFVRLICETPDQYLRFFSGGFHPLKP